MELEFCSGCKICCSFGADLASIDVKKLPLSLSFKIKNKNIGMIHKFNRRMCPALARNGCSLPYKNRPLDCRIFPMTFRLENGRIVFYLEKACPFIEKLPKGWIDDTKKEILRDLRQWLDEEIIAYSNMRYCGKLVLI